jgi:hypothetical protein
MRLPGWEEEARRARELTWNAHSARIAAGFAKPIQIDHGKASTLAPAARPARHVRSAIRATRNPRHDRQRVSEQNSTRRDGVISARGWKRPFEDPIPLPRGRQLVTLEDAGKYIQKLPKAEQQIEEWQTAIEVLLLVAEHGGPTMMARIGVMRALNRHHVREFNPKEREPHWGPTQA